MYLIRLDDASEQMNHVNWNRIISILVKYHIRPIIGIIPDNKDDSLTSKYDKDDNFWDKVLEWQTSGYALAMHGFQHKFCTSESGINPINNYSEFAGLSLEEQEFKIEQGYKILIEKNIVPTIFFAPAHTFDNNTLQAIKNKTDIKIISDTIANNYYFEDDFYFIPQQLGKVRNIKFKLSTFCYHPNNMSENDFLELEKFLKNNYKKFTSVDGIDMSLKRTLSLYDKILKRIYFLRRKIKR